MLKMISWNVNGLRAVLKKDFMTIFNELDADWFCLQETKMQAGQVELDLPGYYQYFNYAERKGYSGTAIFTKHKPLNVTYGMGIPEHDTEGRIITLEYPKFYLMTVYTPNSGGELNDSTIANSGIGIFSRTRMNWQQRNHSFTVAI